MIVVARMAAVVACVVVGAQAGQIRPKPASDLVPKLSLGRPAQIGTLAVVPIESTIPLARDEYLTLAEATKLGAVEIVEVPGQQQVNTLEVRNKAKLPILLFAGELLLGGKQDRIVAKDSIVPALERRDVPVFCVEHGRWSGTPEFHAADTFVNDAVRKQALSGGQGLVWDQVAAQNSLVPSAPATGTIRGSLGDPAVRANSEKLLASLVDKFKGTSKTVGVICWIDGKIESADIFANPALFQASKTKLFRSYALDVQLAAKPKVVPLDLHTCRTFLTEIVSARRDIADRSGYGRTYRIQDGKVTGFESGNSGFSGGIGGGMGGAPGSAGFSHGVYKPGGKGGGL